MKTAGVEVKRGKHLAFKIPNGKRFIRCDSLGDDYTEAAIMECISGIFFFIIFQICLFIVSIIKVIGDKTLYIFDYPCCWKIALGELVNLTEKRGGLLNES